MKAILNSGCWLVHELGLLPGAAQAACSMVVLTLGVTADANAPLATLVRQAAALPGRIARAAC